VLYIVQIKEPRVPRKKTPVRRVRKPPPVGEWLPLPILLIVAAGIVVFAVYQLAGIDNAALAAVALALAGGLWWHRYQSPAAPPRRQRRTRPRRR
jgi:hypothetical protein